ncbi:rRNA-processing protein [Martiniozyma asiatica (nom. inval.)]|nr:rRNA-processing protein [Martiniozyma asiatica]
MGIQRSFTSNKSTKKTSKFQKKSKSKTRSQENQSDLDSELNSDSSDDSPETDFLTSTSKSSSSSKNKHAPTASSIHERVSVIRPIPGLKTQSTLHKDVRFTAALGKVDYSKARKDYAFLDEYREKEIKELESMLKNKKLINKMDNEEIEELKYRLQSTKSRLQSLQAKDREDVVVKQHLKDTGKAFMKRSDKRRLIQTDRFDRMSSRQRSKVVERKRKRQLGKEMRQFEFNK